MAHYIRTFFVRVFMQFIHSLKEIAVKDITLKFEFPNAVEGTLVVKAHDEQEAVLFVNYVLEQMWNQFDHKKEECHD